VCSLPCEVGQAKKYVEGERCCWHCFNCTQYQVRVNQGASLRDDYPRAEDTLRCAVHHGRIVRSGSAGPSVFPPEKDQGEQYRSLLMLLSERCEVSISARACVILAIVIKDVEK